jgi:hypothetical protein
MTSLAMGSVSATIITEVSWKSPLFNNACFKGVSSMYDVDPIISGRNVNKTQPYSSSRIPYGLKIVEANVKFLETASTELFGIFYRFLLDKPVLVIFLTAFLAFEMSTGSRCETVFLED